MLPVDQFVSSVDAEVKAFTCQILHANNLFCVKLQWHSCLHINYIEGTPGLICSSWLLHLLDDKLCVFVFSPFCYNLFGMQKKQSSYIYLFQFTILYLHTI